MKHNLLKSIFISLILMMGVSNAWAVSEGSNWYDWANSENVYFDNTNSSYSDVSMLIGRQWNYGGDGVGSSGVNFTKIENTNNLYYAATTWDHYNTLLFMDATGWGWEGNKVTQRYTYADNYTNTNNVNINGTELFYAASNAKGAELKHEDLSGYDALNSQQTIQSAVNGAVANSKATISITSYKMTAHKTTTEQTATLGTGANVSYITAARTATTTLTVGDVAAGYQFDGWYTAATGGTQLSKEKTYIYYPTAATTVYARFSEIKYTVTVNNDEHGTTTPSGEQSNVGQVTGLSIKATPAANYEFVNWTITSGSGSFGSATSASTTFKPTSAATIQANFRSTATYSLTVVAGNGISQVAGSKDPVTLGNTYDITATPKTGYAFNTWTANPAANATFGSATTANTTVTVKNGSVTVTASATENMSTLTTSNKYDAGDPGYEVPTATVNSIGYETTATVTATAAGNGYTFTGWTLTNCTRTDGGADDATSITVRSNGDGKAAIVVANYAEDLTTSWVLKGSFVDDFATAYKFVKKSGESTGNVAYASVDLAANTTYQFKVVTGSTWYGNNNYSNGDETWWIKATMNDPWEFYSDADNCYMKSALAGTYTFRIDYSGTYPKVSVYFPEIYAIVGTFNNWNENTNKFVFDGNVGTATVDLQGSATDYEFKVIDNGVHGGIVSKTITKTEANMAIIVGGGDDIKLTANVYPNGEYVFTYDKSTKKLSVTYPTAYTVTYGVGNNKGTDAVTTNPTITSGDLVLASTSITFSKGATKAGYKWKNWNSKADGTGTNLGTGETYTSTNRTAGIDVYACYDLNTYTVAFDANGGTGEMTPQEFEYSKEQKLNKNTFTKDHYTFAGWATTIGGDKAYNDQASVNNLTTTDGATITLYAKWTPTPYNITYNTNGGNAIAKATYTIETETFDLPTPTKTGSEFAGWYENAEFTGDAVASITKGTTGDKTFYAKWNTGTFTVTLDMQSGEGGTTSVQAIYGDAMPKITIPTRTDHLFDGYYDQTGGKGTKYYNADGTSAKNWNKEAATLYARWIPYSQCIFFKNNLKWTNVYVYTFKGDVWGNDGKGVYPANRYEYGKMTQIGKTDVYYYILTDLTGFSHIAFSEKDMATYDKFYDSEAVYRSDRFDQLPLFIPQTDQKPTTTNQTKYYSNGIWMKYNSTYSGYDWSGKTGNEDWGNHKLTTENAGSFSFTTTVSLNAGTTYEFKISHIGRAADNNTIKDNAWYGKNNTTFTPSKHSNITFYINNDNAKITPTVDGQYTFTIYLGDGNVVVSLDYPLLPGDYRLAYKDDIETTLRGGDYIKKWNEESVHLDTTSFFVRHDQKPQIVLQHCTAITDGVPTWTTDATYPINSLSSTDVYNFVFKQSNAGSTHSRSVETSLTHLYSGNYYIRTDIAPGGWNTYKQNSHAFTHFNKYDDESFNHYWVSWTGDNRINVKACLATDYNSCLTETLEDYTITSANVRFSYNNKTNVFDRAFLGGSTKGESINTDFLKLVVRGKTFANGALFTDISNWVYEVEETVSPGTTAHVSAKHENFKEGKEYNLRENVTLLGTNSTYNQNIRVIYDFKKNRMVCGWVPGDMSDHNEKLTVEADMLVVRVNNNDVPKISMTNEGDINGLNRIYFVMELTKENVIDNNKKLFWFSVPFECKLKDVFGIEGYGEKWVIQRYRGDKRAEYGFRPEIETFWANMKQNNTATLEPNRGYVLSLNLKEEDFKTIGDKSILRLYFPSSAKNFTISNTNEMTMTVPEHLCTVQSIEDREPLDSHWNVIGIPGYQPVDMNKYTEKNKDWVGYEENEAPTFLYEWQGEKDSYQVVDGTTVKYQHFYAYMVQFAGTIDWSQYTQNTPNPAAAPRRVAKKADKRYKLLLSENGTNADQTFITLSENGSHEYSIGNDLEKIGSTSVARIYTQEGNWNLAANHLSDTTTVLPLTLSIPAEGEYTLSLEQGRYSSDALLYDSETGTYTDLSKEGYTFTAEAGVNNERFALRFGMKLPGGNPTDLQQSQAQYLVRTEGQRIIIEGMAGNVRLYDMTGRVMTQLHANDYTEITVPVTGVYILQVGNQFEKMIIK